MTAEGQKDPRLVEDGPHATSELISHIFPPASAWVVVLVVLECDCLAKKISTK